MSHKRTGRVQQELGLLVFVGLRGRTEIFTGLCLSVVKHTLAIYGHIDIAWSRTRVSMMARENRLKVTLTRGMFVNGGLCVSSSLESADIILYTICHMIHKRTTNTKYLVMGK